MQISDVKIQDGYLCLKVPVDEAMRFRTKFKAGNYELAKKSEKRSKNANDYAWALITEIGRRIHVPPVDVYRQTLRTLAIKGEILTMNSYALPAFTDAFTCGHIGRFVDTIDDDGVLVTVAVSFGSSSFDRRQMSEFIEALLDDCRTLEIETKDPGYIKSLLEDWKR